MKSKAPLALMEQLVMVLVFALAAALCLRVFLWSDLYSRQNEERDQAVLRAQTAAELIKGGSGDDSARLDFAAKELGGTRDHGLLYVYYDRSWQPTDAPNSAYALTVQPLSSALPGLGSAEIQVAASGPLGQESALVLYQLDIAWQKERAAHD